MGPSSPAGGFPSRAVAAAGASAHAVWTANGFLMLFIHIAPGNLGQERGLCALTPLLLPPPPPDQALLGPVLPTAPALVAFLVV